MVRKVISIISLLSIVLLSSAMAKNIKSGTSQYDLSQKEKHDILNKLQEDDSWVMDLLKERTLYTEAMKSISVDTVELSKNGSTYLIVEVLMTEFRGATGRNSSHWVYEKKGDNYRLLLDDASCAEINLEKNITNGYKDISCTSLWGYGDGAFVLYKYDGNVYKQSNCWSLKNGKRTKEKCK